MLINANKNWACFALFSWKKLQIWHKIDCAEHDSFNALDKNMLYCNTTLRKYGAVKRDRSFRWLNLTDQNTPTNFIHLAHFFLVTQTASVLFTRSPASLAWCLNCWRSRLAWHISISHRFYQQWFAIVAMYRLRFHWHTAPRQAKSAHNGLDQSGL